MQRNLFQEIRQLVAAKEVIISSHGYDERAGDNIFVQDVLDSVNSATVVEEYPDFHKGPCVLVLQKDRDQKPVHVVWGQRENFSCGADYCIPARP